MWTNLGTLGLMSYENYRDAVSAQILRALDTSMPFLDDSVAQQLAEDFLAPARALSGGGKRTRALLLAAGFEAIAGPEVPLPVHGGAAVELYQVSALVHDDIIDEARTRRGLPATHIAFATQHNQRQLLGNSHDFGVKAGLLLGDFLLSLAGLEIERAEAVNADASLKAREIFHAMTAETAFGQFMDMRAEFTALSKNTQSAIDNALVVLLHKSARYSVELPLLIGAALGGATAAQLTELSAVGRPLGEAFQLRDDELGIFGDPLVTGKPAGGDLAEGKRTVLLALTRSHASADDVQAIDNMLGRPLTDEDVRQARQIIRDSGAFAAHEHMINEREDAAVSALTFDAPLLKELMDALSGRKR
ncbi:MAG: polyprenyl synthetase family protein [Actinomycetaceae bacterium]|nr:polyprenyl synthetase family protein [Actinomycetaceae bacterium]